MMGRFHAYIDKVFQFQELVEKLTALEREARREREKLGKESMTHQAINALHPGERESILAKWKPKKR